MTDRDRVDDPSSGVSHSGGHRIPSVDIPSTDIPDGDGTQEIAATFWRLVLVFNISLLGVAIGVLVLVFESDIRIGGLLVTLGAIVGLGGVVRYRRFKRSRTDQ